MYIEILMNGRVVSLEDSDLDSANTVEMARTFMQLLQAYGYHPDAIVDGFDAIVQEWHINPDDKIPF